MLFEELKRLAKDALLITVGIQHDGAAYELDSRSRELIEQQFPEAKMLPVIFLGHRRESEFDSKQPPKWEGMATLLTGLTPEQIAQLGGVRIYSPERRRLLWEWKPLLNQ